jgi:hypothetical protein
MIPLAIEEMEGYEWVIQEPAQPQAVHLGPDS